MVATSFEHFYRGSAFHRKSDSDNDSAISLSLDNAAMEKQRTMSVIQVALADRSAQRRWTWSSTILAPIMFMLPSFVGRRLQGLPSKAERHGGVAALDGLRGLACLIVFNARLTTNYVWFVEREYAATQGYKSSLQLPIIRLLWSSSAMIDIFFIISGYVLAFKPLRQLHSGNVSDAYRYLTSSTIRRGLRLYLPTLFALFATALLSWIGMFDQARSNYWDHNNVYELSEASPHRFVSLTEQMKDASRYALKLLDCYRNSEEDLRRSTYDSYLWSISAEFRNSMTLLLSLLAVSRLRFEFRFITITALISFFAFLHNRSAVLFLLGMLIADIDQMRFVASRHVSYTSYYHELTSAYSTFFSSSLRSSKLLSLMSPKSPFYLILFTLGVLICSIPSSNAQADYFYGEIYARLSPILIHFPENSRAEWIRIPGSVMIVWSAANSHYLRFLFVNRFAKYLGKISLAFYLAQGVVLRLVLHTYIPEFYHQLGNGTKQGQSWQSMVIAWMFGVGICLPLTIWIADIFARTVEQPCVIFAHWLEDSVSEGDEIALPSPKRYQ